jgi:hypothetical protein
VLFYDLESCLPASSFCLLILQTWQLYNIFPLPDVLISIDSTLMSLSVIWWHIKVHWHFWRFLFGSGCNCSFFEVQSLLQNSSKLLQVFWQFLMKQCSVTRQPVSSHHAHTPMHAGLDCCRVKLCVSACCCVLYFMKLHVSGSLVFLFRGTNSRVSCLNSWKCPNLGPLKDFWVEFAFISFYFFFCAFLYLLPQHCSAVIYVPA